MINLVRLHRSMYHNMKKLEEIWYNCHLQSVNGTKIDPEVALLSLYLFSCIFFIFTYIKIWKPISASLNFAQQLYVYDLITANRNCLHTQVTFVTKHENFRLVHQGCLQFVIL